MVALLRPLIASLLLPFSLSGLTGCDAGSGDASSGPGGGFTPGGPNEPGETIDAPRGPDPFEDAGAADSGAPPDAGCDDAKGNFAPCDDPGGAGPTCLTPTLCQKLVQSLLPRSASYAMACIDSLDDCSAGVLGDCFVGAAQLACSAPAEAAPPCDAVAALCAGGDPFGAVSQCQSAAPGLVASAANALADCLTAGEVCSPDALGACAATLLE